MHRMKTLAIALMAIGLTAAVGCKKDKLPEEPGNTEPSSSMIDKTFTASIAEVAIKQDMALSTTDLIAMYDGYGKSTYNIASVDEQGKAEIKGQVDSRATVFQAVYPYSAANAYTAGQEISVYIPDSQRISTGETASASALVCMGKEASGNILFESIVSYLELEVPEGTTQVTVRGAASGPIAGDVYVAEDGSINVKDAAWTPETEQSVTIVPDGETFAAGTYYVCLLPATFGNGFTIVYQSASATEAKATSEAVEFKANAIVDASKLSTSTAQTGTEFDPFIISTVDELMGLSSEKYAAGTYVKLAADMDMSDQAWTPISIACHFDGDNHKIYNIKVSGTGAASIFNVTSGASLKNIVFGSSDGKMYDGESSITVTEGNGKIGLLGENRGTLENVITYIPVTAQLGGTASSEVRIGGLVSSNYNNITSCANYGDIDVSGTYTLAGNFQNCFVGGITGWASNAECTIKDTENHGDIVINSSNVLGAGGIAGMLRGENIDGCVNTGTMTVQNAISQNSYFGGIVGYSQQNTTSEKKISNCTNSGEFNIQSPAVTGVGGIYGCIHLSASGPVTIENCKNTVDISVATANEGMIFLGGILARVAMPGDPAAALSVPNVVKNCTNEGNIALGTVTGAKYAGSAYIGGVVGAASKNFTLEDCTNSGAVSSSKLTVCHAGGILGISECETLSLMRNVNKGNVTLSPDKSAVAECYAGGILGTSRKSDDTISQNENSAAEVSIVCNSASASYKPLSYVGGIVGGTTDDAVCTTYKNKNSAAVLSDTQAIWVPTGGIMGLAKGSVSLSEDVNLGDVTLISTNTGLGDMFAGGIVGLACAPAAESTGEVKTSLSKVMSFCDIDSDGLCGLAIGCIAHNYDAPVSILDSVFGGTYVFKGGEPANAADAKIEIGGGLLGYKNPQFSKYTQSGNKAGNAEDYGY